MTHKITVYRRRLNSANGYKDTWVLNYAPIMEVIEATKLGSYFVRRYSKYYPSYNAPGGCLPGDTKEIFIFKYKLSESKEFFAKLAALKDIPSIAECYLIKG